MRVDYEFKAQCELEDMSVVGTRPLGSSCNSCVCQKQGDQDREATTGINYFHESIVHL